MSSSEIADLQVRVSRLEQQQTPGVDGSLVAAIGLELAAQLAPLKADIFELKRDISGLKADVAELKRDVKSLRDILQPPGNGSAGQR